MTFLLLSVELGSVNGHGKSKDKAQNDGYVLKTNGGLESHRSRLNICLLITNTLRSFVFSIKQVVSWLGSASGLYAKLMAK